MSRPPIKDLPALMEKTAGLLELHHNNISGIRAVFHRDGGEGGIRLLVGRGEPYTDEVCDIDLLSIAVKGHVRHEINGIGGHAQTKGTWEGSRVTASHLYFTVPQEREGKGPCSDPSDRTAERLRGLMQWASQPWTRHVESLHVYDENGSPRVHVVLLSDAGEALADAVRELLDATPGWESTSECEYGFASYGSVLMADGDTVLTISSIRSEEIESSDTN